MRLASKNLDLPVTALGLDGLGRARPRRRHLLGRELRSFESAERDHLTPARVLTS